MAKPKVFVSFDYDDRSVKEGLVAQERDPACPFDFADNSITVVLSDGWVAEARRLIAAADYVVVLCGTQSHQSKRQLTELQIAKELGKRHFLLRATREHTPTRPRSARPDEPLYPASWPTVAALLRGEHPPTR